MAAERHRLHYIDNLRIFCISLVVLHHLAITYGAPGDWIYKEGTPESLFGQLPLILFASTNQAFFMGLLFFISAWFVSPSFNRKGPKTFLTDRLVRLGIPTAFYYFLLGPFCGYLGYRITTTDTEVHSFFHLLRQGWGRGFGPMWFVEVLLYFTLAYMVYRIARGSALEQKPISERLPSVAKIVFVIVLIGLITGLVRVTYPIGRWVDHLNLQLAHFPQYITTLILGVVAWHRGWLDTITFEQGVKWFVFANLFILVVFGPMFVAGGAATGVLDPFMGGWHWQSFAYSLYEQVVGISLMIGLIGIFKGLANKSGRLIRALSDSTYTAYIIHIVPVLIVPWIFKDWQFPLLPKFMVLALPTLTVTFAASWMIRRLPFASRVL